MKPPALWRVLGQVPLDSVSDRLGFAWRKFLHRRMMAWWDRQQGRDEGCEVEIEPGLAVTLSFDSVLGRLMFSGGFEQAEQIFTRRFLRAGDVYVDVGANIGLFTLVAARAVAPGGAVHCFEPCAETFRRLVANVSSAGFAHVVCHPVALSDAPGEAEMMVSSAGRDAWNSLAMPGAVGERESIRCTTWDRFAVEQRLESAVALMKIDVEGWECKVLQGGATLLARDDAPVLQVEFTDEAAQAAGSSCAELYDALVRLGYRLYRFEPAAMRLVPQPPQSKYGYMNLFAVKDFTGAERRLAESTA